MTTYKEAHNQWERAKRCLLADCISAEGSVMSFSPSIISSTALHEINGHLWQREWVVCVALCGRRPGDRERERNTNLSTDRRDSPITSHMPSLPVGHRWRCNGPFLQTACSNPAQKEQGYLLYGYLWDSRCLKYFVISLALQQAWHARRKYCIGGEFKIMLSPKQLSGKECVSLFETNPHHVCLHWKERLVCFTSRGSNQSGSSAQLCRRRT